MIVSVKDSQSLQRLQNMCLKKIYNRERLTPTVEINHQAGLLTLKQCRWKSGAIEMYKISQGLSPPSICNMFEQASTVQGRTTRSMTEGNLYPPLFWLEWAKRSLRYRGYRIWDSLPTDLKQAKDLENFKDNIKGYLLYQIYFVWPTSFSFCSGHIYFPYIYWYVGVDIVFGIMYSYV